MKKTLGIIGGMGPMATADLYRKIVSFTDAASDNDHIHVIIDSNVNVPDRTAAILHGGKSPVGELTKSAKLLENAGAEILMMPCNTAHYFYSEVAAATGCTLLHMLRLTAAEIKRRKIARVGLLATDGTVQTGIYARLFDENGIAYSVPAGDGQKTVMDMIYGGVKAGKTKFDTAAVRETLDEMMRSGVEAFVLGCTELPIAFADYGLDYPTVDPTSVLARAAVEAAGYRVKG